MDGTSTRWGADAVGCRMCQMTPSAIMTTKIVIVSTHTHSMCTRHMSTHGSYLFSSFFHTDACTHMPPHKLSRLQAPAGSASC